VATVLCTGVDRGLVETRRLILEQAGHTVVIAADQAGVINACKQRAIDVAVISQTVPPGSKKIISSLIRQHSSSAKILELHQAHQAKALEDADSWLEVPAGVPQDLADRVTELAAQKRSQT